MVTPPAWYCIDTLSDRFLRALFQRIFQNDWFATRRFCQQNSVANATLYNATLLTISSGFENAEIRRLNFFS